MILQVHLIMSLTFRSDRWLPEVHVLVALLAPRRGGRLARAGGGTWTKSKGQVKTANGIEFN